MKVIYRAERNQDQTEGRGPMVPIAYFFHKTDAQRAAKGHGVMGVGDGDVVQVKVYESFDDWGEGRRIELRERALSKLTPEERKALGV